MLATRLSYGIIGGLIGALIGFVLAFLYALVGPWPMSGGHFFDVFILVIFMVPFSIWGNRKGDKLYLKKYKA